MGIIRGFYGSLETNSGDTDIALNNKVIRQFWEGIWSLEAKPRASWISQVRTETGTVQHQEDPSITVEDIRSVLRTLTEKLQDSMKSKVFD